MTDKLRIHLREEFVDTGFIQVFQWRNFEDYFNIEIEKAKKEVIEEIEQINLKVLDREQRQLNNNLFPMDSPNVSICLSNYAVELQKELKKLKEK